MLNTKLKKSIKSNKSFYKPHAWGCNKEANRRQRCSVQREMFLMELQRCTVYMIAGVWNDAWVSHWQARKTLHMTGEQEEHPAVSPESAKWIIDVPICVFRDSVQTGRNTDGEMLAETRGTINHDKLYKTPGQFSNYHECKHQLRDAFLQFISPAQIWSLCPLVAPRVLKSPQRWRTSIDSLVIWEIQGCGRYEIWEMSCIYGVSLSLERWKCAYAWDPVNHKLSSQREK